MPSGYTKKRRIGWVRNNGSSDFILGLQENNIWLYQDPITNCRILTSGQALVFTDVSAATAIPTTSQRGIFRATATADHNVAEVSFAGRIRTNGITPPAAGIVVPAYSQVADIYIALSHVAPLATDSSQIVEYKIDAVPSSNGGLNIDVVGYYDRI